MDIEDQLTSGRYKTNTNNEA